MPIAVKIVAYISQLAHNFKKEKKKSAGSASSSGYCIVRVQSPTVSHREPRFRPTKRKGQSQAKTSGQKGRTHGRRMLFAL